MISYSISKYNVTLDQHNNHHIKDNADILCHASQQQEKQREFDDMYCIQLSR